MTLRVAENLGQLNSNGTTVIDGKVTETGIKQKIDDIYREELFPLFSDKFPRDFKQKTYPQATYTKTGIVDASSSTTTLITISDTFDNDMEGQTIENADGDTAVIDTYNSNKQVTLTSSVDWDGDTIYVLGNEFTLKGDVSDLKELEYMGIKYSSSDSKIKRCEIINERDLDGLEDGSFSEIAPLAYLTSVDVDGEQVRAVGIRPSPSSYQGKYEIRYTERPDELGDDDEPRLKVVGISEVIINGVTSWAKRVKGDKDWKDYHALYSEGKGSLIASYKPRTRSGSTKIRMGSHYSRLRRRYY